MSPAFPARIRDAGTPGGPRATAGRGSRRSRVRAWQGGRLCANVLRLKPAAPLTPELTNTQLILRLLGLTWRYRWGCLRVLSTQFALLAAGIATVGLTQKDLDSGSFRGDVIMLPLGTNARSKMEEQHDGFVKIFCRRGSRIIAGAVIVSEHASELIHALTVAVEQRLTADELATTFTVYPSLSGSIAEAARQLHVTAEG